MEYRSDYDQWKDWLDKWGVVYSEEEWNEGSKELIIRGHYCVASIAFDLENNFKCVTGYE